MADTIPWSDLDGSRTPSARDTALMAAWRTFTAQPRVGNTHDWLWAAIVHGYDIAAEEVARLTHARDEAYDDAQRDAERADALAQQLAAVRAVADGWDDESPVWPAHLRAILAPSPVTPESTDQKDETMKITLTEADFITRYDDTHTFPLADLSDGDYVVGWGHVPQAQFAATVSEYDRLGWPEAEATTEADVMHAYARQTQAGDEWCIQWRGRDGRYFTGDDRNVFPITLVSR